jgi:phenylacetate-CoA ligase
MTLKIECASPNDALQERLPASLRAVTKLGGSVELVPMEHFPIMEGLLLTNAERIASA